MRWTVLFKMTIFLNLPGLSHFCRCDKINPYFAHILISAMPGPCQNGGKREAVFTQQLFIYGQQPVWQYGHTCRAPVINLRGHYYHILYEAHCSVLVTFDGKGIRPRRTVASDGAGRTDARLSSKTRHTVPHTSVLLRHRIPERVISMNSLSYRSSPLQRDVLPQQ